MNPPDNPTLLEQTEKFLSAVFGNIPDGLKGLIWTLDAVGVKRSIWVDNAEQAVTAVAAAGNNTNVYFGLGLSPADYGVHSRCEVNNIAGLVGFWIDADVKGPTHDEGAAETIEVAQATIDRFGLRPTFTNFSGTGLQAFWLFNEPWIFADDRDRLHGMYLATRMGQTMESFAKARGFSVRGTFDIARVMRVPGTFNQCKGKCEPQLDTIISSTDCRYEPSDFETYFIPEGDIPSDDLDDSKVDTEGLVYLPTAEPPAEKLAALIDDNPIFAASWDGQRVDKTWDRNHPSEYNLSVAIFAAAAGWSKQAVVDLIIAQRRAFGVDLKLGQSTYKKTIARAFAKVESKERETAERDEAARAEVEKATRCAQETGNASAAFQAVAYLANVADGPRADAIAKLKSILGDKLNIRELKAAIKAERRAKKKKKSRPQNGLPNIIINGRQLPDVTADVIGAIAQANVPPVLFSRGGSPTRIRPDDDGTLQLQLMNEAALRARAARCANFLVITKDGEEVAVSPPMEVIRDIQVTDLPEYTKSNSLPPIPLIESIVTMPVLRPDWSVLDAEGYDAATRLYYDKSPKLNVPLVPENPTAADLKQAVNLIDEAIGEFPYEAESDYANAIGTLITPAVRHAIEGKTPLALFDAPQAGTGKSLLGDVIGHTAIGNSPPMMSAPETDAEWRKQITAVLLTGPAVIVVDNLAGPLSSPALAMALTCRVWSDRLLSTNTQAHLKQSATWICTGNNIELGGDLARRCYRCRLDAKTSRPWKGRSFRHPDLLQWVLDNRGRLVWAILTLCRGWHVAGRPPALDSPVLGSFESWCRTVGGILEFAGIRGFLGNLDSLYEQADDGSADWEQFLVEWHKLYSSDDISVGRILTDLQTDAYAALRDALPEELGGFVKFQPQRGLESGRFVVADAGRFKIKMGKQLKQRIGRRFGFESLYLSRREDSHAKSALWAVNSAGSAGSCGSVLSQGVVNTVMSPHVGTHTTHGGDTNHMGPLYGDTPATARTPRKEPDCGSDVNVSEHDDYESLERQAMTSEGM